MRTSIVKVTTTSAAATTRTATVATTIGSGDGNARTEAHHATVRAPARACRLAPPRSAVRDQEERLCDTTMIVVMATTTLTHGRAPSDLERLLGKARQCKKSKCENDAPVAMKRHSSASKANLKAMKR